MGDYCSMELDKQEKSIIRVLQAQGRISNVDLAEHIGTSESPCYRRVKALEEAGVITGYGAKVDRRKLGLQVTAFILITMDSQDDQTLQEFFDAVETDSPQTSLNDQLKTQGFQIGLNDRLAFVKNLFENNNEDYERVLSQLSTLDSYEEATNLLESIIKPDYNNWEGQEEIEARFLEIIENKFK